MAKRRGSPLPRDLILSCTGRDVPSEAAQKAVRAICKHYGGQMVYVPLTKEDGISAGSLRGVIADAVGDLYAEKILARIMALYGAMQVYIPMEKNAFRETIALEIYERYRGGRGNGPSMNDLAREYGISTDHAFRLWRVGQREKVEASTPYLPFPELGENINPG